MVGFTQEEIRTLRALSTPGKIQDFLDALPANYCEEGDTLYSPRLVLRERKAHCIEGALLAVVACVFHQREAWLLDLRTVPSDEDHVVMLFRQNGYWGALSKTNHPVLRYRDPVYRTVRELVFSYAHEFFLVDTGRKTFRDYSKPFSLKRFGTAWMTSEEHLWDIAIALDDAPHHPLFPTGTRLRPVTAIEREAYKMVEWRRDGTHT